MFPGTTRTTEKGLLKNMFAAVQTTVRFWEEGKCAGKEPEEPAGKGDIVHFPLK